MSTANRGNPTSPPQFSSFGLCPASRMLMLVSLAPSINGRMVDMDGPSFCCRGRLKVSTSIPEYLPTSWCIWATQPASAHHRLPTSSIRRSAASQSA
ncbi:hypothetical protein INS49_010443 [Diaporthe citri]|uniref:uncharacterized protein n=1 Tax=Diaporthe citri TaxID=83186 RepID=UPI001C811EB9|nr:uncharacterized protein INS49_010443 [Diaporthe citri]KAG6362213.1 hypothetical protein INS49_010443 [Diaporthe citri]